MKRIRIPRMTLPLLFLALGSAGWCAGWSDWTNEFDVGASPYMEWGGGYTYEGGWGWGFTGEVARPGWGCQYVVALGDVQAVPDGGSCRVKVLGETPMIFAPRVEFAWPVAEAELDGQPWHYFEGRHVFLPQSRGERELRVRQGTAAAPHLTRTYANIESTSFSNGELILRVSAPPWRPTIPQGLRSTGQIEHPERSVS